MSYWIQSPDLTFDEEHHKYFWRGVVCQGVTSVMDRIGVRENDQKPFIPVGCPDFAKTEDSRKWGSSFHWIAEIILRGGDPVFKDEQDEIDAAPWIKTFRRFLSKRKLKPLYDQNGNALIEYPLYNVLDKYAGTLDLFAQDENDKLFLIDWKTSSSYQKSYGYQTAAYEKSIREVFKGEKFKLFQPNKKITRQTVLFSPDDYEEFEGEDSDWTMFRSMLNILSKAA